MTDNANNEQYCNISCNPSSSTHNSTDNSCDCKTGYLDVSLVGLLFQCGATCDPISSTLDSTNTC